MSVCTVLLMTIKKSNLPVHSTGLLKDHVIGLLALLHLWQSHAAMHINYLFIIYK